MSRSPLGPTYPIQWAQGVLSWGCSEKLTTHLPTNAEIKYEWLRLCLHGVDLENFTFTFSSFLGELLTGLGCYECRMISYDLERKWKKNKYLRHGITARPYKSPVQDGLQKSVRFKQDSMIKTHPWYFVSVLEFLWNIQIVGMGG